MLRHYEMFVQTATHGVRESTINIMDIIYYHTFGDYRMVLVGNKIEFQYRTLKLEDEGQPEKGNVGNKSQYKGNPVAISNVVERADTPGINYVYAPGPSYNVTEVEWMKQELNKGSSGLRLMLPSIGTLMMSTYGYGNINVALASFIKISLIKLSGILREENEDADILRYMVDAIKADSRWGSVRASVEVDNTLEDTLRDSAAGRQREESIKHFTDQLIESTTSRFTLGSEVRISPSASFSSEDEEKINDVVDPEIDDFEQILYEVAGVQTAGNTHTYRLQHEGTAIDLEFTQKQLLPSGEEEARLLEKQKKGFVAIPAPHKRVFYSIIIDQMFALQAYLFTIKMKNKLNFGYMSPVFMPQKSSEFSAKRFPEMYSPNLPTRPAKKDYLKGKPKENDSFLFQLLQHRNMFTQMILGTQRRLAMDTRVFDEFYKEDLTLKEIKWLATALSDEGKVLVAEPDKSDPLAQLVYKMPGTADPSIQVTAQADRRTVFYKIDIPMLKEVIVEYVKVFNDFTIKSAFALQSSEAVPKVNSIAQALWTSLKKRSVNILENNEAIPHEFFNSLFEAVRRAAEETDTGFDLYPPNWSDSNVLTQLTVDPSQLNTILTPEEYQSYLNDYIEYLYTRYASRAGIAAAVTTAIETYRINAAMGFEEIRDDFFKMLTEHEKKKQLKATTLVFRAYSIVIAIMRGQLGIPLSFRDEAIAEGHESAALREQLRGRPYGERGIAAVPPEHPLFTVLNQRGESNAEEAVEAELEEAEAPVEEVIVETPEEAPEEEHVYIDNPIDQLLDLVRDESDAPEWWSP